GDRDGNPSITAQVTDETMSIHAEHALLALEAVATRVGRSLTVDAQTTPPSRALLRRLKQPAAEPHRQFLLDVAARLRHTRMSTPTQGYRTARETNDDLLTLQASPPAAGPSRLPGVEAPHPIW